MLNDAWKYETAGASPAVIARQAQDSAAVTTKRPVNSMTLMGMGFKELCKTAPPEQVAEAALHAFDGKPEQQGEWADKALAATTEPSLDPKQLQQISGALAELKATMEKPVAKAKDAPASRDDILARMVAASKPSAMRRYRIQAAKEEKRAKDRAALEKKKAFDRAVEADKLADQKRQDLKNRAFAEGVRRAKARHFGKDVEPAKTAQIGELSPGGGWFALPA